MCEKDTRTIQCRVLGVAVHPQTNCNANSQIIFASSIPLRFSLTLKIFCSFIFFYDVHIYVKKYWWTFRLQFRFMLVILNCRLLMFFLSRDISWRPIDFLADQLINRKVICTWFNRFDSLNLKNGMGLLVVGQKRFVDNNEKGQKEKKTKKKGLDV